MKCVLIFRKEQQDDAERELKKFEPLFSSGNNRASILFFLHQRGQLARWRS